MRTRNFFITLILIVFFITSGIVLAQGPHFQFTLQSWATYTSYEHKSDSTTTQMGFGIRRARLRGKMTVGKFTAFIQYDAAANMLHDAQLDFALSKTTKLRMGRFVGAGSQAGGRTSHTAIDFAERSIVGRLWASGVGRADYRSYGLAIIGKAGFLNYEIMASNGDGGVNLKPYNTKSTNSDEETGGMPQMDFMVSSQITPYMQAGFHYGLPNENRVNKSSMTAFLYMQPKKYTKGKFRAKVDFAQIVDKTGAGDVTLMGYSGMAFMKFTEKMEFGVGYMTWDPNTDMDKDAFGNIVLGLNYSPNPEHWKDTLFKLVTVFKNAQVDNQPYDPFQAYLVWQVYMH